MGGSGSIVDNGWEWVESRKWVGVGPLSKMAGSGLRIQNPTELNVCHLPIHMPLFETLSFAATRAPPRPTMLQSSEYNRTLLRPEFISAMDQFIQRITNYIADVSHSSDFIEFPHSK